MKSTDLPLFRKGGTNILGRHRLHSSVTAFPTDRGRMIRPRSPAVADLDQFPGEADRGSSETRKWWDLLSLIGEERVDLSAPRLPQSKRSEHDQMSFIRNPGVT